MKHNADPSTTVTRLTSEELLDYHLAQFASYYLNTSTPHSLNGQKLVSDLPTEPVSLLLHFLTLNPKKRCIYDPHLETVFIC